MNNYRMGRVVALGLSFLSGMFAQVGMAQQSHSDSSQLEEIVVTAEKRESTVQKTPISLTAISGQDIQDRGLTDLGDLVQSVPGVAIRTSGPGMTEFEMRGVSSTGGNSPTVGFYYDDVSLTAPCTDRAPWAAPSRSSPTPRTLTRSTPRPRWSLATPTMAASTMPRMPWSICRSAEASRRCASSGLIRVMRVGSIAWSSSRAPFP